MFEEKSATEFFDGLREQEERNYQGLKRVLGESFELIHDLLALYDVFFKLSLKPVVKLEDAHQIPALLHSLQWMKHEAIAGTMTLMRGHITDSSNFSRRALEICAFIVRMYRDEEAAKRWMEAGTSNKARERYVSAFPAWKLVKELLTPELVKMYEDDCLDVHPSFFAVTKRASLDDDRTHRFSYFDLDGNDGHQTFLVMNFFNICICHGKIMEFLTTVFYPSGHFDSEKWLAVYVPFVQKFQALRELWRPIIDAHFAEQEVEAATEKAASQTPNEI